MISIYLVLALCTVTLFVVVFCMPLGKLNFSLDALPPYSKSQLSAMIFSMMSSSYPKRVWSLAWKDAHIELTMPRQVRLRVHLVTLLPFYRSTIENQAVVLFVGMTMSNKGRNIVARNDILHNTPLYSVSSGSNWVFAVFWDQTPNPEPLTPKPYTLIS